MMVDEVYKEKVSILWRAPKKEIETQVFSKDDKNSTIKALKSK